MGIPYSREINYAFDQVTPLVAAGFTVLQTTKNISILLAAIQVVTVLSLLAILAFLVAIAYSVNPDLEEERRRFVTPALKRLAALSAGDVLKAGAYVYAVFFCFFAVAVAAFVVWGRGEREGRVGDVHVVKGKDGEEVVVEMEEGDDEEGVKADKQAAKEKDDAKKGKKK